MVTGDVTKYLNLVTSGFRDKPNFIASLTAALQPFADSLAQITNITESYDVDVAVGSQLDVVGEWVGVSRNLEVPLTGVYFAFNTSGLGFNEGVWQGPYDPDTGLLELPDDQYRLLIKAKIANNQWDGTLDSAYAIYSQIFNVGGNSFFLQDLGNLTIALGVYGVVPNQVTLALLTQGYLDIKPAGVRISNYLFPSESGPLFAFNLNDGTNFGGFNIGSWAAGG